jgi:hypothetical protein
MRESFIIRFLDKINNLKFDTLVSLTLLGLVFIFSTSIVSCTAVHQFAPPDPNPRPHAIPVSPAMAALKRELYNTNDPELMKYFSEKILELEERENSRRQIIINHVAPITSSTK